MHTCYSLITNKYYNYITLNFFFFAILSGDKKAGGTETSALTCIEPRTFLEDMHILVDKTFSKNVQ